MEQVVLTDAEKVVETRASHSVEVHCLVQA
jgi:hypothetical protein